MLEEVMRKIKVGYRISNELLNVGSRDPELETYEGRMAKQRNEPVINENIDIWEGIGYMSGIACYFIRHPLKSYEIMKE